MASNNLYVYRASGENMLVVFDGNPETSFFSEEARSCIKGVKALTYSYRCLFFPEGRTQEDPLIETQRLEFNLSDWILAAAIFGDDFVASILLVNKKRHDVIFVVDGRKAVIVVSCAGTWAVDETGNEAVNYLDFLAGISDPDFTQETQVGKAQVVNLGYAPEPQEEEVEEVDQEEINALLESRFQAVNKNNIANYGSGRVLEDEEEETNDQPVNIQVERPAFQGAKKGKIRNLDGLSFEKKSPAQPAKPKQKSQPVPRMFNLDEIKAKEAKKAEQAKPEQRPQVVVPAPMGFSAPKQGKPITLVGDYSEKPEQKKITPPPSSSETTKKKVEDDPFLLGRQISRRDEPEDIDPIVIPEHQPRHETTKKSKIQTIVDRPSGWHEKPKYFYQAKQENYEEVILNQPREDQRRAIEEYFKTVEAIKKVEISPNCIFSPSFLNDEGPLYKAVNRFKAEDWIPLAFTIRGLHNPVMALLCNKEDQKTCIVLNLAKGNGPCYVYAVVTSGIIVSKPYSDFPTLLRNATTDFQPLPQAPKQEKPVEEKQQTVTFVDDHVEVVEVKKRVPHRRVFVTSYFEKKAKRLCDRHPSFEADLNETIQRLISDTDEELAAYLNGRDRKPIDTGTGRKVMKFQFGNSTDYEAARLFFVYGYDSDRHMDSKDLLLCTISSNSEHDQQTKIAQEVGKQLEKENLVIKQMLLPVDPKEELDRIAHLSAMQFGKLEAAKKQIPHAFIGSAGTGKTIMSLRQCIDAVTPDQRALYLTYQKDLRDYARKKLAEQGAPEIETFTFRDLVKTLLGESKAESMEDKRDFREWFGDSIQKNAKLRNRLNELGGTIDDQFLIVYIFYRGIIDGSIVNLGNRNGAILSKKDFLKEVSNEKGFSLAAKETIYEVATSYENHLRSLKRTTDNKLAYEIYKKRERFQIYDLIVIDEFQDLSEIQFLSIISLMKPVYPKPLYIFGDDNQAINPTIFNIGDAERIVKLAFGNGEKLYVDSINNSYRSGPHLVSYINDINAVKQKAIGKRKGALDAEEISNREDKEDALAVLIESKETLNRLIDVVSKSDVETVFIFPTVVAKDAALALYQKQYPELKSSFLSVEESKGREWDSVVLVGFFSSSCALFDAMLGEEREGRHSTIHRMLFNRFYVALTRAKNRIIVFENNVTPLIKEKLLSGLTAMKDETTLLSYFKGNIDPIVWLTRGKEHFERGNYEDAIRCFDRAGTEEASKQSLDAMLYIEASENRLAREDAIALYIRRKDYQNLKKYCEDHALTTRLALFQAVEDPDLTISQANEVFCAGLDAWSDAEAEFYFALLLSRINRIIKEISITKEE